MKALDLMVVHLNLDWNNWFVNQPILLEKSLPASFCFSTKFGGRIRWPIFFTSTLLSLDSVQSSSHQKCHHQIVFAKLNLKVVFPPPYEREVWDFKKVNLNHI